MSKVVRFLTILFVVLSTSYISCPSFSTGTNLTCLLKSLYHSIAPSCGSQAVLVDKERRQVLTKRRIINLEVISTQTGSPKLAHALQVLQLLLLCRQLCMC